MPVKQKRKTRKGSNQLLANSSRLGRPNLTTTPGNPNLVLVLPELIGMFASTGTAIIASNTNLTAGLLTNFGTRFAAFDEYRILKFKFFVYPLSAGQGYASVYVDPLSNAVPTATTIQTNVSKFIPLTEASAQRPYVFVYNVSDYSLLGYQPISTTTFNYGFLKVYTDVLTMGNSVNTGNQLMIRAEVTLELRGLA